MFIRNSSTEFSSDTASTKSEEEPNFGRRSPPKAGQNCTPIHSSTVIGWSDPRQEDGEPLWPERFDAAWCEQQKQRIGSFAYAGQYQQRPAPRGGGIVRREWWQVWPPRVEEAKWTDEQGRVRFPAWELVIAYLDTAFTQKDESAFCAFTRWAVFDLNGTPKVMLASAWRDRPTYPAGSGARLGAGAGRYSFIVMDFHHLLLAGDCHLD
jgi:hypothetical protein